jgi:predicted flap endonuclease-1-like 5' DNA nuclease
MLTAEQEKEKERQRLAEEAKKNQSFGARIRNIFDHQPTPPPAPEQHHLFSHAPPPPQPKDWKDKLSELTGVGAKPEKKEGIDDEVISVEYGDIA